MTVVLLYIIGAKHSIVLNNFILICTKLTVYSTKHFLLNILFPTYIISIQGLYFEIIYIF